MSKQQREKTIMCMDYGYPALKDNQVKILCEYMAEHLELNYGMADEDFEKDVYILELNDAPGGMRSSW